MSWTGITIIVVIAVAAVFPPFVVIVPPVVIARRERQLVGFLVSSSRAATEHLPLSQEKYRAYPAGPTAYNSGPLCIVASARGRGLVSMLFAMQRSLLPGREGVAFIRRDNAASRAVHARRCVPEAVARFLRHAVELARAGIKRMRIIERAPEKLADFRHIRVGWAHANEFHAQLGDHRQLAPIISHDWEQEERPPVLIYQPYASAFESLNRLHDRLRYTRRPDGTWLLERLAP